MSQSLLQSSGRWRGRKHELFCVQKPARDIWHVQPEPDVHCPLCRKKHPQVYRFWRVPCGAFGKWTVFRFNREKQVPDLSVPIGVDADALPRGAEALNIDENAKYWHSQ